MKETLGRHYSFLNLVLMISFILSLVLLVNQQVIMSGHATVNTPSNVSIRSYLAIDFSVDLASGIVFENIMFLPANNVDAVKNFNETDNGTGYFVRVSPDGNTPIDLCVKASGDMMSFGGDSIPLVGETFAYSQFSNLTFPSLLNETSLTLNYSLAGENIPIGSKNYLRFWLDVPASQPAGEYNNSIYFKGLPATLGC